VRHSFQALNSPMGSFPTHLFLVSAVLVPWPPVTDGGDFRFAVDTEGG